MEITCIIGSLPGQNICLLQSLDIWLGPTQSLPPWATGGLVQERLRVWVPPPQDAFAPVSPDRPATVH